MQVLCTHVSVPMIVNEMDKLSKLATHQSSCISNKEFIYQAISCMLLIEIYLHLITFPNPHYLL